MRWSAIRTPMYPSLPVNNSFIGAPPSRRLSVPDLPRRLSGAPQPVEVHLVTKSVHALPEAVVAIRGQLVRGGQLLERLVRPVHVARNVVEHTRLEHEVAAVDPAGVELRLLLEPAHCAVDDLELPEAGDRPDGSDRGQAPSRAVVLEQRTEVDIGDAVAVGHHERLVVDIRTRPNHPTSGLRLEPGIDQGDLPGPADRLEGADLARGEVDRHVRAECDLVGEVSLDVLAAVAEADH